MVFFLRFFFILISFILVLILLLILLLLSLIVLLILLLLLLPIITINILIIIILCKLFIDHHPWKTCLRHLKLLLRCDTFARALLMLSPPSATTYITARRITK